MSCSIEAEQEKTEESCDVEEESPARRLQKAE